MYEKHYEHLRQTFPQQSKEPVNSGYKERRKLEIEIGIFDLKRGKDGSSQPV